MKLIHYYHIYCGGGGQWQLIMNQHMMALCNYGLIERLHEIRVGIVGPPEQRKAVKEISRVATEKKVTSVNFLLTDGSYLYALKKVYRGRNSLFYRIDSGFRKSFVIASKPLGGGWTEMENGQLVAVDASDGSIIRTKIL